MNARFVLVILVGGWFAYPWDSFAEPPGGGFTPTVAVGRMKTPAGLDVTLVASEPLVRQPVAIEFDDRGRMWVIQYLQYPNPEGLRRVDVDRYSRTRYDRMPEPPPHGPRGADRITILSDTDGDGLFESGHDFVDGLNLATGLALGHGGVFVLNVPYLLFYPDHDRDDVPDSDPEVLLTGFGMEDAHSVANSLTWGPDGWLYGCQGSTVTANIRGIEFQQGVWRYHPITREFELFCEGGGNSWGLDFDRVGELLYSTNYGGFVLLHGVQGGYFVKSFAKHGGLHNPFAYGHFEHASHADFRGGHVTVGGIVYQGDALPRTFRDKYIAGDLLGHGVRWHSIHPDGSTVRTANGGELLVSQDTWFAPTDITTGPDGAIYVADWYDARTAHPDPDAQWDRSNGRIYRIGPAEANRPASFDFAQLETSRLLELHDSPNQWMVRRARLELVRRGDRSLVETFRARALQGTSETVALESLWSLNALHGFDEPTAALLLTSPHAAVRSWTVRLLGDLKQVSADMAKRLDDLAEREPELSVRRQLACTAARLPAAQAMPIINANILRDIDHDDPRMPLLWWWAVERHCVSEREEVLDRFRRPSAWRSQLACESLLPRLVRRYATEATDTGWASVDDLLNSAPDEAAMRSLWHPILAGWSEQTDDRVAEFRSRLDPAHPIATKLLEHWQATPQDPVLLRLAIELGLTEPRRTAVRLAFSDATPSDRRIELLNVLAAQPNTDLQPPAWEVLTSSHPEAVRIAALGIVARATDEATIDRLVELFATDPGSRLQTAIGDVLLSRRAAARKLLTAIDNGVLPAGHLPLEQARRVAVFDDPELNALVTRHWGSLRAETPEELLAEVRRLNNDLRAGPGDARAGRTVYTKHCGNCHRLFDDGGGVGPDLTPANRQDREFLLTSLVDPSGVVRKEYVSQVIQTTDGRILTGLLVAPDSTDGAGEFGVTLIDAKQQKFTVPASQIEDRYESSVSLMPADLYRQFSPQDLRDLFAYLQSAGPPREP